MQSKYIPGMHNFNHNNLFTFKVCNWVYLLFVMLLLHKFFTRTKEKNKRKAMERQEIKILSKEKERKKIYHEIVKIETKSQINQNVFSVLFNPEYLVILFSSTFPFRFSVILLVLLSNFVCFHCSFDKSKLNYTCILR